MWIRSISCRRSFCANFVAQEVKTRNYWTLFFSPSTVSQQVCATQGSGSYSPQRTLSALSKYSFYLLPGDFHLRLTRFSRDLPALSKACPLLLTLKAE